MTYLQAMLLPDIRKAFVMRKTVQPFGVAFGTVQNGLKLPRPQTMAVGQFGMGLRNTKRALRKLAQNAAATGAVLVHLAEFERKKGVGIGTELVLVQLEHRTFGDMAWTARIKDGKLEEWVGPLAPNDVEYTIPRTTFLPGRWMH